MSLIIIPPSGGLLDPHVTPYSFDFVLFDDGAAGANNQILLAPIPASPGPPEIYDLRTFFGSRSAYLTPIFERLVPDSAAAALQLTKVDVTIYKQLLGAGPDTAPDFIPTTAFGTPPPSPTGFVMRVPAGGTGVATFWRVTMKLRHSEGF